MLARIESLRYVPLLSSLGGEYSLNFVIMISPS